MSQPDPIKRILPPICQLEPTKEWLCLDSIAYITECLEASTCIDMIADLREIFPRQTLKVASIQVCQLQRQRIKKWLVELNKDQSV